MSKQWETYHFVYEKVRLQARIHVKRKLELFGEGRNIVALTLS
jgi:hypothetical protein